MSSNKPYMPFYTADYINDTAHLTLAEHGAYLLLIIHYWNTEKPLPDDDKILARVCRTNPKAFRRIKLQVSLLFSKMGQTWVHKRIENELAKYHKKLELARLAGQKSAEKRWGMESNGRYDSVTPSVTIPLQRNCNQSESDTDTDTDNKTGVQVTEGLRGKRKISNLESVSGTLGAEPKIGSAPLVPIPASPVFIFIPARDGTEFGVTEDMLGEFERSYPHLDVRGKLQKIRTWSLANTKKQKTRGGMLRFINYWLAGDNDRLSDGLNTRKLSVVEHNQLLLESRQAQRRAERLGYLQAGEETNASS